MGETGVSLLSVCWFLHPSAGRSVQLLNIVAETRSGGQERGLAGQKKKTQPVFKMKMPVKEK